MHTSIGIIGFVCLCVHCGATPVPLECEEQCDQKLSEEAPLMFMQTQLLQTQLLMEKDMHHQQQKAETYAQDLLQTACSNMFDTCKSTMAYMCNQYGFPLYVDDCDAAIQNCDDSNPGHCKDNIEKGWVQKCATACKGANADLGRYCKSCGQALDNRLTWREGCAIQVCH